MQMSVVAMVRGEGEKEEGDVGLVCAGISYTSSSARRAHLLAGRPIGRDAVYRSGGLRKASRGLGVIRLSRCCAPAFRFVGAFRSIPSVGQATATRWRWLSL